MRSAVVSLSRRAALLAASAAMLTPSRLLAEAPPTYSLKGIPGLGLLGGSDAPRPELGVIGRGASGEKSGLLNFCDKKGCISTFAQPDTDFYIPPWTYQPGYSTQATSSYDAQRQRLREQALAEQGAAGGSGASAAASTAKGQEQAFEELRTAIVAAEGQIVQAEGRYIYAEFTDKSGAVDDVEFLFSKDSPIVGYRSAARKGNDDKRQRNRIRDLRKSLKESGWKSVGRLIE